MYFRKYFEGTMASYAATKSVTIKGTSSKVTAYANQTQIINEAIMETLLAAGVSCEYDDTNCIMYTCGGYFQILAASNAGNPAFYRPGASAALVTAGTSYGINSGTSYKFYVTLKGDPKGMLLIKLGYYSSPSAESYGVHITQVIDLRDQSEKIGVGAVTNINMYVYNKTGSLEHDSYITFSYLNQNTALTKNGGLIPLVECIDNCGFFKLDNCYKGLLELEKDRFYDIGGDIFYHFYNFCLIKCTTEVS